MTYLYVAFRQPYVKTGSCCCSVSVKWNEYYKQLAGAGLFSGMFTCLLLTGTFNWKQLLSSRFSSAVDLKRSTQRESTHKCIRINF